MDSIHALVADAIAEMQDATDDAEILARHVLMRLAESGYVIAYQSLCWCEGKAEGTEHTPGCPEAEREARR